MPTVKKLETLLSQMETLHKAVDQEIAQLPSIKMIKTSSGIEGTLTRLVLERYFWMEELVMTSIIVGQSQMDLWRKMLNLHMD